MCIYAYNQLLALLKVQVVQEAKNLVSCWQTSEA